MLFYALLPLAAAVDYVPYEATDPYKCGSFVAEQVKDPLMSYFYSSINGFIRLLSRRFNHERLFNTEALHSTTDMRTSIREKYSEIFEHEQWWLTLAGSLIFFTLFFTFSYVVYSCWVCCCCNNKKKDTMDSEHDSCKRYLLNCIIGVFVILNIFSVATLLVSSQYAQYGADELPQRFGQCLDDLSLYKRETEARFKKLLLDDYHQLNETIANTLSTAGRNLVQKVKKATGAQAIDVLVNITNTAAEIVEMKEVTSREVKLLNEALNKFRKDFSKVQKVSNQELLACISNENEPAMNLCEKARKMLNSMDKFPKTIEANIISEQTYESLRNISVENISALFTDVILNFAIIETELQSEINHELLSALGLLKRIGDILFQDTETITAEIRHFNFEPLYSLLASYNDKNSVFKLFVRYCWYGSLILSGVFALIALYFLFAWCYGCFGRRPTYYEDDCCVRTTGSKLFTCGIWLSIFLLVFLATITAVLLLLGGNFSNLICHSLSEPLDRKDMLSFIERIFTLHRLQRGSEGSALYKSNVTLSEFIQACSRNQTLYTIFDLEKKYRLMNFRELEKELFDHLDTETDRIFESIDIRTPVDKILTEEKIKKIELLKKLTKSISASNTLNFTIFQEQAKRRRMFIDEFSSLTVKPKAITEAVEQLKSLELISARRLMDKLDALLINATLVNQRLANLSLPMGSVVGKLQHAQALLTNDFTKQFRDAAQKLAASLKSEIIHYLEHLRNSLLTEVTSCIPLTEIARGSRAALCDYTVDPFNGIWASMLISISCIIPIIVLASCVKPLYNKMHAYPKYVVHEPLDGNQMNAFETDTYDIRSKQ